MWDTASRTVELLGRLQGREPRTAADLAAELSVTPRTVRRDIARLRDLGYPIDTRRGPDGGYSLEPGAVLPPIFLTVDDAVTASLALLDNSLLQKIEHSVPTRIRSVTQAVTASIHPVDVDSLTEVDAYPVPARVLGDLASACTRGARITFVYTNYDGDSSPKRVEPHRIINASRRWYLAGYDLDRHDWRLFRIDRLTELVTTDTPVRRRPPPDDDWDRWATTQLGNGWQRVRATVRAHGPADSVRRWIAPAWGTVQPETDTSCLLRIGADSYDAIAQWLMLLGTELTVIEPPELLESFRRIAIRAEGASHPCAILYPPGY